jgi:hypothetical protein
MPSLLKTEETDEEGKMSKARSHSFSGHERNSFFRNARGNRFDDLSSISGLDHIADGRSMAFWDYDRDGWRDIALVNANSPQLVIYHNDFGEVLKKPANIIAIRFQGGANGSNPTESWSNRDGYGAVITVETPTMKQTREHRCGEGFAAQNSALMLVALGEVETAARVSVKWPSGRKSGR